MQVQELVGIIPWTFVAQICNLFIQMYLIKRFLFKPVHEILEKRRAAADAEIIQAEEETRRKRRFVQNMNEICRTQDKKPMRFWTAQEILLRSRVKKS